MKKLTPLLLLVFCLAVHVFAQTDVETIVGNAQKLAGEEKVDAAIAEINKAIAIEPQNADLYLRRAEFYFITQNKPEILKDAGKAASLAPTDKQVLYRAALVLHRSQQAEQALKVSDEMMALGNVDRFGWSLRIQIKTHLEDFFGAFEAASNALELFPDYFTFQQNQANLIRLMGNSQKALEMFDSLIKTSEKKLAAAKAENEKTAVKRSLSMFLFSRAGLQFTKLNKEQALDDLRRAVENSPDESNYFQRAKIYKSQKMYAEALADLSKLLEIRRSFDKPAILIERGDVYYFLQKYPEALADYEETVKLDGGMREIMQRRIELAKQKIAETSQPK